MTHMLIQQGECPKCEDRGDFHGHECIVSRLIFNQGKHIRKVSKETAMNLAVQAIELFIKGKRNMHFRDDVSSEAGKNFLRLKQDRESVVGVFQGEPYDFRKHWINNGQSKKAELCTGKDCKLCAEGVKSTFSFRLNFVMYDPQQQVYFSKIFEQGMTVYEALRSLHKDYPLDNTVVKITRNGTGNNTTYMILPVPGQVIDEAKKHRIKSVILHDLVKLDEPIQQVQNQDEYSAAAFAEF